MMSEKLSRIILFGNPEHPTSSNNRLNSLAKEIFAYARSRIQAGELDGMSLWLYKLIDLLANKKDDTACIYAERISGAKEISLPLINEICAYLDIDLPISTSINIAQDLRDCNLIIATSNSPDYLIYPEDLQAGAVVCDVARPADVAPSVYQRDDVLILEGGLVQYPDNISFGANLGYRDGVSLACLSETVLLALEGDCQDYSIGTKLPLETVHYLRSLAQKHGFGLAGLKMGNQEITDQEIEKIYLNSLHLGMVEDI